MPDRSHLDPDTILAQAAALAAHLQRSGVQWLPRPQPDRTATLAQQFANSAAPFEATPEEVPASPPAPRPTGPKETVTAANTPLELLAQGEYSGEPTPPEQRPAKLQLIDAEVRACVRCEVLAACRTNTVFGEGNASPRFVFFGEGPGADEDRLGRPFVGRAGELLTKMIQACRLKREEVYILNTVKCRPPGNRNPEPHELENCRDYYRRQLDILRPEYIVCLGAISSRELLQNHLSVGKLRGRLHRYFSSKVLVTYHPAYLLRNPSAKKAAWADLQLLMRDAQIPI